MNRILVINKSPSFLQFQIFVVMPELNMSETEAARQWMTSAHQKTDERLSSIVFNLFKFELREYDIKDRKQLLLDKNTIRTLSINQSQSETSQLGNAINYAQNYFKEFSHSPGHWAFIYLDLPNDITKIAHLRKFGPPPAKSIDHIFKVL